ncbi:ABC transporter permease [Neobacillus niacini]|uniref:ABC transporter permease n=1 Tax=Neobacillus niacini TaxID=86668 RepID=UPI0005EF5515|nr:ABC transporter permease subunit [Neobacillus niacini]
MVKKPLEITLIGILTLFILLPFIPLVIWSFTKHWPWPLLMPENWTIESWTYLFSISGRAFEGILNSFIVAAIALLGNIVLGIPAARALAQNEFIGKNIVFSILLAPLFIPYTISIIGMHDFALRLDFLNDYVSTAIAHILVTLPYFVATIWFQYRLMGKKLNEAASILGANEWKIFLWIEFPLLVPSFLLGSFLVLVVSYSQYLPTWIMSGGTLLTLPLVIFPYANSGNSSIVSAYSLLFFAPILLLLIIYFLLLRINNRKNTNESR